MQTQGKSGIRILRTRVCSAPWLHRSATLRRCRGWTHLFVQIRIYGVGSLWYGALATAAATFVGHYPVGHFSLWPFLRPHSERKLPVVRDLQLSRRCEFFLHVNLKTFTQLTTIDSSTSQQPRWKNSPPGLYRFLRFRHFRYCIQFPACRQNLSPSQRDSYRICGCRNGGRGNGWLAWTLWKGPYYKVYRKRVARYYVFNFMEVVFGYVSTVYSTVLTPLTSTTRLDGIKRPTRFWRNIK